MKRALTGFDCTTGEAEYMTNLGLTIRTLSETELRIMLHYYLVTDPCRGSAVRKADGSHVSSLAKAPLVLTAKDIHVNVRPTVQSRRSRGS